MIVQLLHKISTQKNELPQLSKCDRTYLKISKKEKTFEQNLKYEKDCVDRGKNKRDKSPNKNETVLKKEIEKKDKLDDEDVNHKHICENPQERVDEETNESVDSEGQLNQTNTRLLSIDQQKYLDNNEKVSTSICDYCFVEDSENIEDADVGVINEEQLVDNSVAYNGILVDNVDKGINNSVVASSKEQTEPSKLAENDDILLRNKLDNVSSSSYAAFVDTDNNKKVILSNSKAEQEVALKNQQIFNEDIVEQLVESNFSRDDEVISVNKNKIEPQSTRNVGHNIDDELPHKPNRSVLEKIVVLSDKSDVKDFHAFGIKHANYDNMRNGVKTQIKQSALSKIATDTKFTKDNFSGGEKFELPNVGISSIKQLNVYNNNLEVAASTFYEVINQNIQDSGTVTNYYESINETFSQVLTQADELRRLRKNSVKFKINLVNGDVVNCNISLEKSNISVKIDSMDVMFCSELIKNWGWLRSEAEKRSLYLRSPMFTQFA